jgi:Adenomatosis polyposis coli down-regulated 1
VSSKSLVMIGSVLSMLLGSCSAQAQAATRPIPLLAGQWLSAGCESQSTNAERSIKRSFLFSDWAWQIDVAIFKGADCTSPLVGIRVEGVYTHTGPSAIIPGASEATFFYTRKSAAALTEAGVALLRESKCGTENWRLGLEQDISSTGCLGFPAITANCPQEFDIISIEGGELRAGLRSAKMCEPSGRPARLSGFPLVRPASR